MFIYIFCHSNLNILQFIVHHMMIKQPSQTNLKNKSREKLKSNSRGSQPKPESSYKKICRVDPIINKTSKSKIKQQKPTSKLKIQKNKPQTSNLRARNEQKNTCDNYGLNMKSDLKHLINKNNNFKPKNTDIVPQLLKNIEKNCKALKNIHEKQSLILGKINSVVETNGKKDLRSKIQNKSHDLNIKPKKSNSKQCNKKQLYQPKINRFSLSLNHNELEKDKEQLVIKEKSKKKAVQTDSKNFVEVFKQYKKSFDIEDLKIQRSNRKTNYNTNQSKNSSSYYNSHAHSRLGDHSSRAKNKEEQRMNLQKIKNLIKNQQKLTDSQRKEEQRKENLGRASMELSRVKQQSDETNNLRNTVDLISFKNDLEINDHKYQQRDFHEPQNYDFSIHQERQGLLQMQFNEQQGKAKLFENETISPLIKDLKIPSQISSSKVNSLLNSQQKPLQSNETVHIQSKFKKSKYYVQMIPRFKQKKAGFQLQNLDDSLIGCQIALLQNNIILQDSQIASLQL